jgi:hypothetical protein
MKLSEFIVLPQDEKRFTVLHEGVPIAQRLLDEQMVFLFQLPHFYVETYCSKDRRVPGILQAGASAALSASNKD